MGKKNSFDVGNGSDQKSGLENPTFVNDNGVSPGYSNGTTTVDVSADGPAAGGVDREQWDRPIEFLFSCISMSVGLGNIWRFPYTAYANGGGVFLIPYLVVLTLIGRPIYFLEMAMGQFSSYGQMKVWKMAPFFKGVGLGSTIGTACVLSYYCSIMAMTIFYFINSFAKVLPWNDCDMYMGRDENGTCRTGELAALYYKYEAFPLEPENVEDGIGDPEWRLSLCLAATWLVIFLSLIKGVKSSGKVAYFTALFPYFVLLILLIQGLTLDGAWDGIEYFVRPDWEKLLEPKVWYEAVSQCFFSLSTGFGPIIMFSSYNPFRHNVYRDALIISLTDTFTSLLAGFTIFAVLGNLAYITPGKDVADVVSAGPGLAFVSYPQAIANFDVVPQLFAVLFFLMLFTLGIGSAASLAGGIITIICDQWPSLKRWMVTLAVSVIGCSIGLIYVTPGGQFMLTLVDEFGAKFVIYVMATVEVAAVAWVYGVNNFGKDIKFMLGFTISWYWIFCWAVFIPIFLTAILFYHMFENFKAEHNGIEFTGAALAAGWILAALTLALIPGMGLHAIMTRKASTFMGKVKESFRPTADWGPRDPVLKKEWEEYKLTAPSIFRVPRLPKFLRRD